MRCWPIESAEHQLDATCAHLIIYADPHLTEWQVKGYIGRYITYTGPDFKEGLSLSIHDEISRMRKYAFGCSELVFNPLSQWLCKYALVYFPLSSSTV